MSEPTSKPTSPGQGEEPENPSRSNYTFTDEDRRKAAEARREQASTGTTDDDIIVALRKKAARGDAAAARELREWLDRDVGYDLDPMAWTELLSAAQREELLGWLKAARARSRSASREQRHARESDPHPPEG